jgi:hypothetical protein
MEQNMTIIDLGSDKSYKHLVSLLREYPSIRSQVKTADIHPDSISSLPDRAFAWPEERRFPIHNKQMAMISSMYRTKSASLPVHVEENFKKVATMYQFTLPERRAPQGEKVAHVRSDDYLLPNERKFVVRTPQEADHIQSHLVKNASVMGYDHMMEASRNLLRKYASFKADSSKVHPLILKYAGYTLSNKELTEANILHRTDFPNAFHDKYVSLHKIASQMDYNRSNLIKIAHSLEVIDKEAGLRRLYDTHLVNPMESVFNTNKPYVPAFAKQASDRVSDEMAQSVSEEQVKDLLGEDILQAATVDNTLDRQMLKEVINSLPTEMVKDFVAQVE